MKLDIKYKNKGLFKNKKQFKEFYEKEAEIYDKKRSIDFEGKYIDKQDLKLILKYTKKGKILECGCGTGRILIELAKKGYNCYGIDTAQNMLKKIKSKASKYDIKIKLKKADIEKIPYPSNYFNFVYTLKVLMHLPAWKKAFFEMYRVVKPNANIIIDFQNSNCPWRIFSLHKRVKAHKYKDIVLELKKYNYKFISMYSYPSFFFRIPILKHLMPTLDKYLPLPKKLRRRFVFIIKKS